MEVAEVVQLGTEVGSIAEDLRQTLEVVEVDVEQRLMDVEVAEARGSGEEAGSTASGDGVHRSHVSTCNPAQRRSGTRDRTRESRAEVEDDR